MGKGMKVKKAEDMPGRAMSLCIMAGITTIYFYSYMQRVAVPGTIFDELQAAFATSASAITTLSVIFLVIYGGMQLVVGAFVDRVGVFMVLLTGGTVLCAGSFLFPMARTLPLLYAGRVLVALGASLIFASVVKSLDALFSARLFPIVLGISISIAYTGGLAGTLPFAVLSDRWGWRSTLVAVGVLTLIAFVITMLLLARVRILRQGNRYAAGFGSIRTILSNRQSLVIMLAGSTNFSVYFLFQATLGKKLLHDLYNLPSATSALLPCIMMLVTISCSLLSGMLSRALGYRRKPVILFALGCMIIGGILLTYSVWHRLNYIWVLASYCLLGFTSLASVMNNTLMKELNPPEAMGTAIGLANGNCYLVMAVYTSIAGYILDSFAGRATIIQGVVSYPREAYLAITGFCMVALIFAFSAACFIKETHGIPTGSSSAPQP